MTHLKTIGVRELQQHASAALRRVAQGEVIGVTARGRLVAILSSLERVSGASSLVASGRVEPARRDLVSLAEPVSVARSSAVVLDELRGER